jgi:hypothetical protein
MEHVCELQGTSDSAASTPLPSQCDHSPARLEYAPQCVDPMEYVSIVPGEAANGTASPPWRVSHHMQAAGPFCGTVGKSKRQQPPPPAVNRYTDSKYSGMQQSPSRHTQNIVCHTRWPPSQHCVAAPLHARAASCTARHSCTRRLRQGSLCHPSSTQSQSLPAPFTDWSQDGPTTDSLSCSQPGYPQPA